MYREEANRNGLNPAFFLTREYPQSLFDRFVALQAERNANPFLTLGTLYWRGWQALFEITLF